MNHKAAFKDIWVTYKTDYGTTDRTDNNINTYLSDLLNVIN